MAASVQQRIPACSTYACRVHASEIEGDGDVCVQREREREREREIAVGQASSIAAASRLVGRPRFVPQEQERCWDDGWIDLIVVASFLIPAHARTWELGATN